MVTDLDNSLLCHIVIQFFFQVLSSIPVRKYTHEIKLNAVTVNKWFNRNSVVLMRESTLI